MASGLGLFPDLARSPFHLGNVGSLHGGPAMVPLWSALARSWRRPCGPTCFVYIWASIGVYMGKHSLLSTDVMTRSGKLQLDNKSDWPTAHNDVRGVLLCRSLTMHLMAVTTCLSSTHWWTHILAVQSRGSRWWVSTSMATRIWLHGLNAARHDRPSKS